jgi:hypothetical protein
LELAEVGVEDSDNLANLRGKGFGLVKELELRSDRKGMMNF